METRVKTVTLDPESKAPAVILETVDDKRMLPIWIDMPEARAIALELERIDLEDEYFVARKLYPNADFYSGIICQAIGFPVGMFPVLFAIARVVGWLAQWQEMLEEADQKLARPRQVYTGADLRDYVAVEER